MGSSFRRFVEPDAGFPPGRPPLTFFTFRFLDRMMPSFICFYLCMLYFYSLRSMPQHLPVSSIPTLLIGCVSHSFFGCSIDDILIFPACHSSDLLFLGPSFLLACSSSALPFFFFEECGPVRSYGWPNSPCYRKDHTLDQRSIFLLVLGGV